MTDEETTLLLGNCLTLLSNIEKGSIDLILCDLPYGTLNKKNPFAQWDKQLSLEELWKHYKRIIKPQGVILLFAQGMFTAKLMMSNEKWWKYNLIWDKVLATGFLNAKRQPLRSHEDICVFYNKTPIYNPQMHKGKPLHGKGTKYKDKELINRNYGKFYIVDDIRKGNTEKYPKSILTFQKPHPSITVYPTQKPISLLEFLIKTYSNEGDMVLDNCMGSGSTGVACIHTKRKFIGMEINESSFLIAKQRIEEAKNEFISQEKCKGENLRGRNADCNKF